MFFLKLAPEGINTLLAWKHRTCRVAILANQLSAPGIYSNLNFNELWVVNFKSKVSNGKLKGGKSELESKEKEKEQAKQEKKGGCAQEEGEGYTP